MSGIRGLSILLALILTACSSIVSGPEHSGAAGYAVGDEANAVRAGAAVLADGGSAADAATAMYFGLAVTYPVAAGLGGGGLCIVHGAASEGAEMFAFLPRNPEGHGPFSLPANVAGFAALQGAYGRVPWQRDVVRAEELATAGFPISSMLAERIVSSQDTIRLDAPLAAEFLDEFGHPKSAGSRASNADLGRTLSLIRTGGGAGFYRDAVASGIAKYSAAQGGAISSSELAAYIALRTQAQSATVGDLRVYFPAQSTGATFASALFGKMGNLETGHPTPGLMRAVAIATEQILEDLSMEKLPPDLGSTGFAAVDASGQAVACAVTMDGPFGSAHTAEGTGVTLARAPSAGAEAAQIFLFPAIAISNGLPVLTGAAAGGPNGAASLASLLLRRASESRGHIAVESAGAAPYDVLNVIGCGKGTCAAVADPGAHGFGTAAGK